MQHVGLSLQQQDSFAPLYLLLFDYFLSFIIIGLLLCHPHDELTSGGAEGKLLKKSRTGRSDGKLFVALHQDGQLVWYRDPSDLRADGFVHLPVNRTSAHH